MALTFKGERTVGELNNQKTGLVKDSAFRIYDNGILNKGNVPVKHGEFVSWTGTQWKIEPSLEFATNADVEAIEEQVEALGQPLQWKGPATVSELNDGIEGIQPGWTYTLTDAGTLTDGSVKVEAGDEVAWTEDDEWFLLGAENKVKIFEYAYEDGAWQYPSISDVSSAAVAGKVVYLCENSPAGKTYYQLTYRGSGSGNITVEFVNAENGLCIKGYLPNGGSDSWTRESSSTSKNFAPEYSALTFPILEGTQCVMLGRYYYANQDIATTEDWTPAHWTRTSVAEQIGNVESKIGSVKNGGTLTSAASVNVPNNACSTLSTSEAALTLNVNLADGEVPNFAVEVTAGAAITLTVTKTVGNTPTTLNYSAAAGNTLESGKLYQVTCVGSCWTLAEFTVPTP